MESERLFFNPSPSSCHGNMFFLGSCDYFSRGPRSMLSVEDTSKKRPFPSSPEDYFDDEYYDEQLPEKKRRLTPDQVNLLEKSFEEENKLEPDRKVELAKKLGLQPRRVAVWFQNRRARWKNKQLERNYDILKASYDSLLFNYDTIIKENEKLKFEVVSLTEKLETEGPIEAAIRGEDLQSVKMVTANASASGSAVVDEDSPQLLDSGNSFIFLNVDHGGIQSEVDEGSDDRQSYFSDVFVTGGNEVEEPLAWWMWS